MSRYTGPGAEIPERGQEQPEDGIDAAIEAEDAGPDEEDCDLGDYLREERDARRERRRFQLARDLLVTQAAATTFSQLEALGAPARAVRLADRLLGALEEIEP